MSFFSDIKIERAAKDFCSWAEVLELLHASFACQNGRIDPPSSLHKMNEISLAEKASVEQLIIARTQDVIVGCVFARKMPDRIYIGKMSVAPSVQGQGIGTRLMEAVERFARDQKCLLLELQTRVELLENHKTFQRLGFVKVSESAHQGYKRPTSITMRLYNSLCK